jgi:hypothetical protein
MPTPAEESATLPRFANMARLRYAAARGLCSFFASGACVGAVLRAYASTGVVAQEAAALRTSSTGNARQRAAAGPEEKRPNAAAVTAVECAKPDRRRRLQQAAEAAVR